jgi:hypothetical protein
VEDGEAFKLTGDETDAEGLGGGVLARRSLLIVFVEPTFAIVGFTPSTTLGFDVGCRVRFCTVFLAILDNKSKYVSKLTVIQLSSKVQKVLLIYESIIKLRKR